LWRKGDYRPPWLWSLVEVLKSKEGVGGARIFSSPSGAGTPRGIHNCPNCDRKVLEAIQQFTFSQDQSEFDHIECECTAEWRALMDVQDAMSTSVDIDRYLGSDPDLG
ncbi:MAG: TIGR01210 family radical SAM protein, partial [Methanomassiliicoccales archaeon]|nr:TIGR01210 family radical SAM protein [Methanomassiliicoccales archaeon]